jgi:hypothetical protein
MMKIKSIFLNIYTMALLLAGLASCSKVELESFTPQIPVISFDQAEVRIGNEADTMEIAVDANLPWRIKTDANWLTLIKGNGHAGEKATIAIQRNRVVTERSAKIIAYITNDSQSELMLIQAAGDPLPDVTRHFYVKTTGLVTNDGLSWANATTLDIALENAVANDVIHIAKGTYVPTKMITGGTVAQDVTFEITENVNIIGGYPEDATTGATANAALNETILSGQLSSGQAYHVVAITAIPETGKKVNINGISIKNGRAHTAATNIPINGINVSKGHGGGVIVAGSTVEFNNVQITNNSSGLHAAGMFITGIANVTFKNSKIANNTGVAETSNGGGIWNDGSYLYMYDSEVSGNRTGGVGGGLYAINTARTSFNYLFNVSINDNAVGATGVASRTGAGIYAREKSKFVIVNSTIYGNNNNGTAGGAGISVYGAATVDLISSTISGNIAGAGNAAVGGGSGIYNNPSPAGNIVNIYNSIVSGNTGSAKEVGGVHTSVSSVLGAEILNANGDVVSGQTFDASTAFSVFANYGGYAKSLPLTNSAAAAITVGMSTLQLQVLASNLTLADTYLVLDQNNKSRSGKTVIGAALPQ